MVKQLCTEAKEQQFCSVCILPSYVSYAGELLKDSGVRVCTVIGFPLGATETQVKAIETNVAIEQGADEIDMVLNIGALKSGFLAQVKSDIQAVVDAAQGKTVKVILETCLLTDDEIVQACEVCVASGAGFVKTSTGFSTGGATVEDVQLMRKTVGDELGVKASGGIKDYDTAKAMIDAGANRLGTSSGMQIVGAKDGSQAGDY